MNTREKFLTLAVILLVAMNLYDGYQVGELRKQVHVQKVKLLKECIADYGVRNCEY